jgi:hypothetical protein
MRWREFQKFAGYSSEDARYLEKIAKPWGANPREWHIALEQVPLTKVIAIEVFDEYRWVKWDGVYRPSKGLLTDHGYYLPLVA